MRQKKSEFFPRSAQIEYTHISADFFHSSAGVSAFSLRKSVGNILLVILLMMAPTANCQKLIRGIVVDSLSLNNIPGVIVKIKGSQRAVVSDVNGIFLISIHPNDILAFSFLGYHAKEIPAQHDNNVMFVRMQEESIMLSEVVVSDYRYLDKKIISPALSSTRAIKAKKGLQPSTQGAGVSMAINFAYFTKEQKEKRKLMATLTKMKRITVYEAIIYEPNFMNDVMKKYSLDEKNFYELLAAFNQENNSLICSGRELDIIYALHYHFSHPNAHITHQTGVKPR
ncbi:hypothetical protein BH09BAC3_BH09BAC3_05000 [soil metagenome]